MSRHILVERRGATQVLRLNRPEKKNALTREMYAALAGALRSGDQDAGIRCHVILGAPGAFSAGNDMADFMAIATGGESGLEVFDFLAALVEARKPIASGVDGIAVGIGTTIQFHCDLTFATPRTTFVTPFVDLGITPEAGSTLIGPALLGYQRAFALLALGEGLPAAEAKALGMIHGVVEEDRLEEAVFAAADRIAAKPPEALRLARDLMRGDREALLARIREEGALFMQRLRSDEARAAVTAFMTRKKD